MKIRVTCPACHDTLEVDAEHVGREVECGSCLQPFTVEDPAKKKKYKARRDEPDEEAEPARKRGKRRRDDDDDEGERVRIVFVGGARRQRAEGLGLVGLVCGVLALLTFCACPISVPLGIAAMVCGHLGKRNPDGRGVAVAASVLGSVALLACAGFWVYVFGIAGGKVPGFGR